MIAFLECVTSIGLKATVYLRLYYDDLGKNLPKVKLFNELNHKIFGFTLYSVQNRKTYDEITMCDIITNYLSQLDALHFREEIVRLQSIKSELNQSTA